MSTAHWGARSLYVAAKLGVADQLEEPRTAVEIAVAVGARPDPLYRVLRALASVGVFSIDAEGRFGLTPISRLLRSDDPGSMRSFVLTQQEWNWRMFSEILQALTADGPPLFDRVFGESFASHMYLEDTEDGRVFDQAMQGLTEQVNAAAVAAHAFDVGMRIVDVGGGAGNLLARVLRANPGTRGVLYDLPRVMPLAHATFEAEGIADRVEVVSGDFFESVPAGSDVYLLSRVLHNWEDDRAALILANVRRVMAPTARLLVIDSVLPPEPRPDFGWFLDVNLMLSMHGRERTEQELRQLFQRAGLRLERVIPMAAPASLLECTPLPA